MVFLCFFSVCVLPQTVLSLEQGLIILLVINYCKFYRRRISKQISKIGQYFRNGMTENRCLCFF